VSSGSEKPDQIDFDVALVMASVMLKVNHGDSFASESCMKI
jgi:hypothetical protein